jgi:hypothetical protein
MLVSSIAIEIKILLINQILDHFVRHPVHVAANGNTQQRRIQKKK